MFFITFYLFYSINALRRRTDGMLKLLVSKRALLSFSGCYIYKRDDLFHLFIFSIVTSGKSNRSKCISSERRPPLSAKDAKAKTLHPNVTPEIQDCDPKENYSFI